MREKYIIIGGDCVATSSNRELFSAGEAEALLGKELKDLMDGADYRIFNLEMPLTDTLMPLPKHGPNLAAPTVVVTGYKAIGADILGIANNQDVQGLAATKQTLEKAGIRYLGAGDTPVEAAAPCIFEWSGMKIGLYACAEHEFSIVSEKRPGVNPYDPLYSFDHVAQLKATCDFVIVLYHGGKEHYRYPSPNLQRICRKFVESGADLVTCQHTHCIGCEEKHLGGTILYGQGNFLYDDCEGFTPEIMECWQTGLLLQVSSEFAIRYIPVVKHGNTTRLADEGEKEAILNAFFDRSSEIQQPGVIGEHYNKFAQTRLDGYLYLLSSKGIIIRILNKITGGKYHKWYVRRRYSQKNLLAIWNFIECEAHRELLIKGIKSYIESKNMR